MMAHFEKRLSSETKFEGRVITVTLDRVELENGGTSTREWYAITAVRALQRSTTRVSSIWCASTATRWTGN